MGSRWLSDEQSLTVQFSVNRVCVRMCVRMCVCVCAQPCFGLEHRPGCRPCWTYARSNDTDPCLFASLIHAMHTHKVSKRKAEQRNLCVCACACVHECSSKNEEAEQPSSNSLVHAWGDGVASKAANLGTKVIRYNEQHIQLCLAAVFSCLVGACIVEIQPKAHSSAAQQRNNNNSHQAKLLLHLSFFS